MLGGFTELGVSQQELSRENKAQSHTVPACELPDLGLELSSAE